LYCPEIHENVARKDTRMDAERNLSGLAMSDTPQYGKADKVCRELRAG
jgi:hypothetical protein